MHLPSLLLHRTSSALCLLLSQCMPPEQTAASHMLASSAASPAVPAQRVVLLLIGNLGRDPSDLLIRVRASQKESLGGSPRACLRATLRASWRAFRMASLRASLRACLRAIWRASGRALLCGSVRASARDLMPWEVHQTKHQSLHQWPLPSWRPSLTSASHTGASASADCAKSLCLSIACVTGTHLCLVVCCSVRARLMVRKQQHSCNHQRHAHFNAACCTTGLQYLYECMSALRWQGLVVGGRVCRCLALTVIDLPLDVQKINDAAA